MLDLDHKSINYVPRENFTQIKKKIWEDNLELLEAFTLGLLDPKYFELFCPGINASYFIDYHSIQTDEDNFLFNIYIKNKVKESLLILSSIFMTSDQTSFRMKSKYGTIHYSLKLKLYPMMVFPSMLTSQLSFSESLLLALQNKEHTVVLPNGCFTQAYASATVSQTLQMLKIIQVS